ncbi:MAG: MATE family efflux transporter [Lachnospiraceae bacterium]|nr:MATE family efflux transporter [Lachnospiraceae bacterium]
MASVVSMTEGPIGRRIVAFSIPLICSNLLQVLFNLSDLAVVGRFAGPAALGAVGSSTMIVILYTMFIIGLASGVNALTARFLGASRQTDVCETIHTGFILMTVLGIVLTILGITLSGPILRLLGTRPDLYDRALIYLRIYFMGMPGMALYNLGHAVFSATGNTKKPLFYLSTAGVVNVLLNLFFVIACQLDVVGVALASAIAQYVSATLIILALLKEKGTCGLRISELHLQKTKAISLLKLGLPAGFQNAVFMVANLFVVSAVNSFSTIIVEGNAAASNADNLIYEVMAAFYVAGASFISQNYGAGKRDRILKSYFWSVGLSVAVSAGLCVIVGLFGRQFLGLFTTDPAVIDAGLLKLNIMIFSYPVSGIMDGSIAASRGLGRTIVPTIIVIIGSCIFRIIWIFTIFAHFHTIGSLYLLYIFSWSITGIAEVIYFFYIYRQTRPSVTC